MTSNAITQLMARAMSGGRRRRRGSKGKKLSGGRRRRSARRSNRLSGGRKRRSGSKKGSKRRRSRKH